MNSQWLLITIDSDGVFHFWTRYFLCSVMIKFTHSQLHLSSNYDSQQQNESSLKAHGIVIVEVRTHLKRRQTEKRREEKMKKIMCVCVWCHFELIKCVLIDDQRTKGYFKLELLSHSDIYYGRPQYVSAKAIDFTLGHSQFISYNFYGILNWSIDED